eukprot:1549052-Alexandrium_andersonii.AAC.1
MLGSHLSQHQRACTEARAARAGAAGASRSGRAPRACPRSGSRREGPGTGGRGSTRRSAGAR